MDFISRGFFFLIFARLYTIIVFLISFLIPSKRDQVVFGGVAVIKYARWSKALNRAGIASSSLVPSVFSINSEDDFDRTWLSTVPKWLGPRQFRRVFAPACAWFWMVRHARVACSPVGGIGFFAWSGLDKLEIFFFKMRKIKIVVITGGGDAYALGSIKDPSLRHALQSSYPDRPRLHRRISRQVRIWEESADVFLADKMVTDGIARCDVMLPHSGVFDAAAMPEPTKSAGFDSDGFNKPITILHAPNHRYFKGTEFLKQAVNELQNEGFQINFDLTESMSNNELLARIQAADIVVDQLIMPGYANFAVESMALGKPVICNLGGEDFRNLMTRYSYMAECPAVSGSPENIKGILKDLIVNPGLRMSLGEAGMTYAIKRHSYESWQELWKIFEEKEFDGNTLAGMNIYHPINQGTYKFES